MQRFRITIGKRTETFQPGNDYSPGETRQHWTLSGLEKLIALGLWKREFDKRRNVKAKPPTVEMMMRLANAQRAALQVPFEEKPRASGLHEGQSGVARQRSGGFVLE